MSISECDPALPTWAHRCGYALANGKPCRRLVADRFGYCFGHSVALGYVAGHRCAHVGGSTSRGIGRRCQRLVRREGCYCWQHEPEGA